MAKDDLCNILYCMVKHDWREALRKSGRTASDMTVMELEKYFEQIELLDNLKQKGSETNVVDDGSDGKKLSKKNKGRTEPSTKKMESQMHIRKLIFLGNQNMGTNFVCCARSLAVLILLKTSKTASTTKS
eukprot:13784658-Ditylum_brightwellii.AAC.1